MSRRAIQRAIPPGTLLDIDRTFVGGDNHFYSGPCLILGYAYDYLDSRHRNDKAHIALVLTTVGVQRIHYVKIDPRLPSIDIIDGENEAECLNLFDIPLF